jgi:hypothetical protein
MDSLKRRDPEPLEKGTSLLELVIAMSLAGVLLFGAWTLFSETSEAAQLNVWSLGMDTSMRSVVDRIATDLKDSGEDPAGVEYVLSHPINKTSSLNFVDFNPRVAFTGQSTDWGSTTSFQLDNYPNEDPTNQIDDDGDGVIDERVLVRVQDGEVVPLAHDVTFLQFDRQQDQTGMSFRVDITRTPGEGMEAITMSRTFFVAFRNVSQVGP